MASIPVTTITHQNELVKTGILKGWSDLFETGEWTYGQQILKFEADFAAFTQTKFAVATNSGTMSLWAALRALNLQPADEVITTPMTFSATADAIVLAGGQPVFAEVDPLTGNLDPVAVVAKITPRTKAILVVHLYGVPVALSEFQKLAKQHNLALLEDASHAHGATFKGKSVGSFGTAGCFSLYPSKTLGALGNAGIVVTNSARIAQQIRRAAHHGMAEQYHHVSIGLNGLIDSVQAVVLNQKLPLLPQWLARKRAIAAYYDQALQAVGQPGMQVTPQTQPGYYTYAIQVSQRTKLQNWLADRGVSTRIYYPIPLHLQPSYRHLGHTRGDFPVAEKFAKQTVSLPLYPELTDAQVEKVAKAVQSFYG